MVHVSDSARRAAKPRDVTFPCPRNSLSRALALPSRTRVSSTSPEKNRDRTICQNCTSSSNRTRSSEWVVCSPSSAPAVTDTRVCVLQVKHAIAEIKAALIEGATMALEVNFSRLSGLPPCNALTSTCSLNRQPRPSNDSLSAEVEQPRAATMWYSRSFSISYICGACQPERIEFETSPSSPSYLHNVNTRTPMISCDVGHRYRAGRRAHVSRPRFRQAIVPFSRSLSTGILISFFDLSAIRRARDWRWHGKSRVLVLTNGSLPTRLAYATPCDTR